MKVTNMIKISELFSHIRLPQLFRRQDAHKIVLQKIPFDTVEFKAVNDKLPKDCINNFIEHKENQDILLELHRILKPLNILDLQNHTFYHTTTNKEVATKIISYGFDLALSQTKQAFGSGVYLLEFLKEAKNFRHC